ncbi:TonB-dependent receptor [Stenotrophomonas koreensis]|uniref:TonB-dependent receptor n=1 Tax=Stenotrophomonas koreensis TaxID=266128 RepID=A0A0R0BFD5_9GAMM|nr:TonB-dependent receptor [Stenotrophomonas koreensis]
MSSRSAHVRTPVVRPLVAALAALMPAMALAQDNAAQQAATLDTISVTAARKSENIQDVPVSISTVSGEKLDALVSGGTDIRFLSGRVPSLNIESSFGRAFPRFYIRGYGNTDFRMNTSQPVSLVYDDIVQENPILKGFPLFDIQQVEVLRGPLGSLFGRNTPAGVVKFDSVRPSQEFEGYGKVGYGSDNLWNVEGAVGGALSERWSARASMLYQRRDDWVENTGTGPNDGLEGYDESAARVQFLYEGEDFQALLGAHARRLNGTARLFRGNIFKPGTNDFVEGFDENRIAIDGQNHSELESQGANARLVWDLGSYRLHSITGFETLETFSVGDIDGTNEFYTADVPFASETADGIPHHSQFTQEFRIESQYGGPLNWQAGVFYFNEDYDVDSVSYDTTNGSVQDGFQRINQANDAWAVFGGINYQASDKLELRAGLRYTVDEKDLVVKDYWNTGFSPCVLSAKCDLAGLLAAQQLAYANGDAVDPFLSASTKDKKVNWDASATYAVNDDVNVYGRVATGFRGSSIQSAGAFNEKTVASPETVLSFELGMKADLWDNRARVNASVFHYEVKDQQLTAVGGATGNANILLNAEKSTGKGFEVDIQAWLTDNLLVTLGSGYNHTEIKDADLSVAPCMSCTVTNPVDANGKVLINGNSLPQAPKWTHNLTARWSTPVGDAGEFYVFTDWAYRSDVNFFLYESKEFSGKSLTEGGLRVGYSWNQGDYDLALYGRNITNQIRATGAIDFNNRTGFINEPRLLGVEFKTRF